MGVAIIGGGVVGAAVVYSLAARGVDATLLEAEAALALGASGTNSGRGSSCALRSYAMR